jgi:hypothetical protein
MFFLKIKYINLDFLNLFLFYSDPYSAVSNVWNAASHANPPHSLG